MEFAWVINPVVVIICRGDWIRHLVALVQGLGSAHPHTRSFVFFFFSANCWRARARARAKIYARCSRDAPNLNAYLERYYAVAWNYQQCQKPTQSFCIQITKDLRESFCWLQLWKWIVMILQSLKGTLLNLNFLKSHEMPNKTQAIIREKCKRLAPYFPHILANPSSARCTT